MSLSAKDRSQENARLTNHPAPHDMLEPVEDLDKTKEHTTGSKADSLVEHILDFLDKYPACFAPRASMTDCMRAC